MTRNEIIDAMARSIYQSRNGHGCVSWSLIDRAHKRPYIGDAEAAALFTVSVIACQ